MGETSKPLDSSPMVPQAGVPDNVSNEVRLHISQAHIKLNRNFALVAAIVLPPLVAFAMLYDHPQPSSSEMLWCGLILLGLVALLIGTIPWQNKLFSQYYLVLNDTSLTRSDGVVSQTFSLSDFRKISVTREPDGQILWIDIVGRNARIHLVGFTDMSVAATHLKTHCPNAIFKDTQKFFSFVFRVMLITLVVAVAMLLAEIISEFLPTLIAMAIVSGGGIWTVVHKPISASFVFRHSWLEIVWGSILILIGIVGLVFVTRLTFYQHKYRQYELQRFKDDIHRIQEQIHSTH